MKGEEEWEISLVQDRFHHLKLSLEQARAYHEFEKLDFISVEDHYLSQWDEWQWKFDFFNSILDEKQLKIYSENYVEEIKNYEESLITSDKEYKEKVKEQEEINRYLSVFTERLKDVKVHSPLIRPEMQSKIDYIKASYHLHYEKTKKKIIIQHYHHSRGFQPNTLTYELKRHEQYLFLPNLNYFYQSSTKSVKAVFKELREELFFLPDDEKIIINEFKKLKLYFQQRFEEAILKHPDAYVSKQKEKKKKNEKELPLIKVLIDQS